MRSCFEPVRARSTGEGPVKAPLKSADVAAVDDRGVSVDPPGGVQAAQQLAVQASPTPQRAPIPEGGDAPSPASTPARAADAATQSR